MKPSTSFLLSHFSRVWLFVTPWTVACQALLSTGILQARILEWVAMPSSRGSSWPKDRSHVSCVSCSGRQVLYHWVLRLLGGIGEYFLCMQISQCLNRDVLLPTFLFFGYTGFLLQCIGGWVVLLNIAAWKLSLVAVSRLPELCQMGLVAPQYVGS